MRRASHKQSGFCIRHWPQQARLVAACDGTVYPGAVEEDCLPVLERTFPYVEAAAIPAVAVPLLQDDCIDTIVDIDWVWDYIHLTSEDKTRRLNLNALHDEVRGWFTRESLNAG